MLFGSVKEVVLKKNVLVPLLAGLVLAAAVGLFGRQDGLLHKSVDTLLMVGFEKYAGDRGMPSATAVPVAAPGTAPDGGTAKAVVAAKVDKTAFRKPVWAESLSLLLCLAVWLSLTVLFAFRSSLVLAGALVWIGGALTASVLLLVLHGSLVSPALPLLAAILLLPCFFLFGRAKDRWDRLLWQQRRDGFQRKMLESLANAVEMRDPAAGAHIVRMQRYVRLLADRLARSGAHAGILTPEYRELLVHLTPLHDIGKAGIKDEILLKPGRLTEGEYEEAKRHVEFGEALLLGAGCGEDEGKFLELARQIVATHHEKWDGSGYPKGLRAGQIPLAGRIVAVADVYDALISKRCYKAAYSHEQSRAILMKGRGIWFDPEVADAFKEVEEQMWRISQDNPENSENPDLLLQELAAG